MARILRQNIDPHSVDWEGNTPSSLAMRSLFTFHVWQNALFAQESGIYEFVRMELEICPTLVNDGWDQQSLHVLFMTPTEQLYLHHAEWRERSQLFKFADNENDGLYMQCCWFQLLDILQHRALLPRGWEVLTAPRQFYRARERRYWHPATGILQTERPIGGLALDMEELGRRIAGGKNLIDELDDRGVIWQG